MKIIKGDKELLKRELEEKAERIAEEQMAKDYIAKMRENKHFRRYIIDGIIRKNIEELTDINKIPNANLDNAEELGKLVIQAKMARKQLEKILGELIR